jgi:hypothetical protein
MGSRSNISRNYEALRDRVRELRLRGDGATGPSDDDRADWAYGNTKMENDDITREMADEAVERRRSRDR